MVVAVVSTNDDISKLLLTTVKKKELQLLTLLATILFRLAGKIIRNGGKPTVQTSHFTVFISEPYKPLNINYWHSPK